MQLMHVDKTTYRKNTNIVIGSFVASLAILALIFGALLIHFFGATTVTDDGSTGNFHLNFLGVICSLLVCSIVLHSQKQSRLMREVYYVWQLKQVQNRIYRKLANIKRAAEHHDKNAFIILSFYFASLKQVYTLDDNTLTISAVENDLIKLNASIAAQGLSVSIEEFEVALLDKI
ncbi:DUF3087 family protein [Shewanella youngdeokensis]|uniref:DUF3087 family protein n=1 Tax=Shewanella youngdeokensis TaxID=2999068 RepID=A0ABZ0JZA4_9GAMM|nr:DUF3087 family protein [Shewanella sp. DAU334]